MPARAARVPFDVDALAALREVVAARARASGLDERRSEDLVLAVHEICTNSVRHGGGSGELRLWATGDRVVCEVQDAGRVDDVPASGSTSNPGTGTGPGGVEITLPPRL
jgi:anti-sigma regulatory factor (Ser/Thr protein kinase)